jgi:multiple sugar transport system permease protein
MPWSGWLVLVAIAYALTRAIQGFTGISVQERQAKWRAFGIWVGVAAVGVYLFKQTGESPTYFRGVIPMSMTFVITVIGFGIATMALMAFASRSLATRGAAKVVITQVALVIGSIVFGIPFAWLLVSSFKEDKDIAQADGLRWVPLITQQAKYWDKEDPIYVTKYKDEEVQGAIIGVKSNGDVTLDINKPMSLRGITVDVPKSSLTETQRDVPMVTGTIQGTKVSGIVIKELEDGKRRTLVQSAGPLKDKVIDATAAEVQDVRIPGMRWQNYPDALDFLPPDTAKGLVYLKNTLILVTLTVLGTLISCTIVAYAFARLQFFGNKFLFSVMLSSMMLPGAVTMLPSFLIFSNLGWVDTLYPLWVPAFFGGAFNVFLLRQFFSQIPMELEDAAKVDGCTYIVTLTKIMVPQIKPALAAIAVMTILGTWNNFMGPLIFINSPEMMPIAYGLQLYNSMRGGEPGLLMAATTMSVIPIVLLFFFAQKYLIEGVTLSGLGGR